MNRYSLILSLVALCIVLVHAHSHCAARSDGQRLAHSKRAIPPSERAFYKFVTRPDIDAPVFNIKIHNKDAIAPGYWFVAPYGNLGQPRPTDHWVGPHIYDVNGDLVWSGAPMFGYWNTFDFKTSMIHGQTMLTLLSDHEKRGFMINSSYQIHKTVPFLYGDETKVNMHEFNVIDDGKHALLLTLEPLFTPVEVSQVVGFNKPCDAKYQGFREVDLEFSGSPKELFHWEAIDHIQLNESTYKNYDGSVEQMCTKGWDILHFNSIVKFPDGDYLLSARHTDTIYKISAGDGSIIWRLGGVKSNFALDGWRFSRQHDAKILEYNNTHTTISLFDNGIGDGTSEQATSDQSRGLIVQLDTISMKADMLAEYKQPDGGRTNARGSFQGLPNGNKFFCWAYQTSISEHAPDGTVLMEARFDKWLTTYRAYKYPWVGAPATPPDVHTEALYLDPNNESDIITVIHVSWNGDTRTTRWRFGAIDTEGREYSLGAADRQGFETKFEYNGLARQIFAAALDKSGNLLGQSEVMTTVPPGPREQGVSDARLKQPEIWHKEEQKPNREDEEEEEEEEQQDDRPAVMKAIPMPDFNSWNTFTYGMACGLALGALVWLARRSSQTRQLWRLFNRRKTVHYVRLEEQTD